IPGACSIRGGCGPGFSPMQTSFSLAQLADPNIAEADRILRTCVHCGFCTATCPTYVLLGDELDSPRGRIYLIKDMLENDRPATAERAKPFDRCVSCLACMTTCPSSVHYMHLVDHARAHVETTYARPRVDRLLRALLARVLPDNRLLRGALAAARVGKPFASLFAALGLKPVAAMLRLAPVRLPAKFAGSGRRLFPSAPRRGRVALLTGCVSPVIAPPHHAPPSPPPPPPGHGGGGGRRGLLRPPCPSHGPGAGAARRRPPADRRLDRRDRGRRSRRHLGHGLGLRHHGEGLRLPLTHRSSLRRQGSPRVAARQGYQRVSERHRTVARTRPGRAGGCLSFGLLAPARPENRTCAERIALQDRIRRERCTGRTSVLWVGRHLQHAPAGACEEVARA